MTAKAKVKVTVEDPDAPVPVVFELEEFFMEQNRDLICDYDHEGRPINYRENPANPGVMILIRGRSKKQGR